MKSTRPFVLALLLLLLTGLGMNRAGWSVRAVSPSAREVAATFTVSNANDSGDGSLRKAIQDANGMAGVTSTITFSPTVFNTPRTITLTSGQLGVVESLTINGPGANLLTISGNNASRVFNIGSGDTVSLSGMTMTNGNGVGIGGTGGGCIYSNGNLTVTNSTIFGNTSGDSGGGILNNGTLTVANSTIAGNTANGDGGGIRNSGGTVSVINSAISSNNANLSGGISSSNGTLTVTNSTLAGNTANGDGGGIGSLNNTSTVTNSTISGNRVRNGDTNGGGIWTGFGGTATINNCTITNNLAAGSASASGVYMGSSGAVTIRSSIIAGNVNNAAQPDVVSHIFDGVFVSNGYNLIGNPGSVTVVGTDKVGTPTSPLNPQLGPLQNNGGATPTHALLGGSPALNAGNAPGLTTDQRGAPRVSGASADIGAVEMQALLVTNTTDSLGAGTLRQAITDANASPGLDDIIFGIPPFNTAQTINLATALPDITSSLTINGPGANLLTVRRADNAATNFRIFNIVGGLSNVAFSGLTISNGRDTGTFGGGGIYSRSFLTLTNVHVTGNQANTDGGGVLLQFAEGLFTGCTFSGNQANGGGGGIAIFGDVHTLRLVNSTVSGNAAAFSGGIDNYTSRTSSGLNSRLEVIGSTIANNTATGSGGGISTTVGDGAGASATTTLRNSIIANNTPNNLVKFGSTATITSQGFNLTGDNSLEFINQSTDFVNTDPLLGPLQDNGGPTPTHALRFGSRALDAGHSSGATTDQRGLARRVDLATINNERDSDGADIGAYEAQTLPPLPTLAINDVSKNEGNSGQTAFDFTFTLSEASAQTVTVNFISGGGTATAGSDYAPVEGLLTFTPGQTSKTITVQVNGDTTVEPDETFTVNLRTPTNATIADAQGQGTIVNDDIPASQIVQNTNDSGDGSLRKVIADAPVGGKVIFSPTVFNAPRTITLTSGELVINKNLIVEGPGANLLRISGNNASRVFSTSASSVMLSGMTITGGNAGPNGTGGGIRNSGSLAVTDSIISGNTAPGDSAESIGGGGIVNGGGSLSVTNSTISGNSTGTTGGGICAIGPLTVMQSTISGNTAVEGGGIGSINGEQVTVINSTISGNTADSGGGIDDCGKLTLTNSTISGNRLLHPNGKGSGIRAYCSLSMTIINSTITNNSGAGPASGLYRRSSSISGTVSIRNSIIASNGDNTITPDIASSDNSGIASAGFNFIGNRGAISFNEPSDQAGGGGSPILYPFLGPLANNSGPTQTHALLFGSPALDAGHSSGQNIDQRGLARRVDLLTINNPAGGDGADIGAYEALSAPVQPPPPTVAINDVSKNEGSSGQTPFDFTVTLSAPSVQTVTIDYFLSGGTATAGSDYASVEGRLTFAPGQTTRTIAVRVNGDTTVEPDETFFINLRSPANATIADGQGQGTILNDDVLSLIVQNTNDSGDGSLRQVIAGAPTGSTVTFSSTVFNTMRTITLTSDQLLINKNLTISGPGANLLTISGGNSNRVFRVQGSGLNVTINDVTIRNGNVTSSIGGGVLSNGTLTMNRCHVADNRATTSGGGVHLDGASGTFNACTFSGNQAANGGGIYFNGTGNSQTLSLTNCTFSNNTGTATGGALAHAGTGGSTVTQINSCTIANNDSADGGGIYIGATGANVSAAATTRNSIYANNSNTNLRFVPANGAAATITSQGFNLTTGSGSAVLSSGGDQLNTDPLLGPLQNNGGPTPTRALLAGSPAQDKGQSANLSADQRGNTRPFDDPALTNAAGGDGSDIGAFEQGQQLFPVSAASYTTPLAMESIVATFGVNLSNGVGVAGTIPLPTTLNDASFTVRDSLGVERAAPLFFAAPSQVNFQVPPGTALGNATIIARRNGVPLAGASMMINAAEPGLFTANSSGTGLPAGTAFRLKANGEQSFEPIAAFNAATQSFDPVPINLAPAGDRVFLILYGTGIRFHGGLGNVKVNVAGLTLDALFAADPGGFIGLDQVNSAELPRTLAGRGQVNVTLLVGAKNSNTVTLNFK